MKKQPLYEPGGIYHIFNHANGREDVFVQPENYIYFLGKYAGKLDALVQTLAYCLMPNHFHLLVKIREEAVLLDFLEKKKERRAKVFVPEGLAGIELLHFIVHRQFHNFLGGYAKAFNKFHGRAGSLLRQNTRRKIVADNNYILNAIRYLHLNPVYHHFTVLPEEWPHSSYHAFLGNQQTRIPRGEILAWFGGKENFIRFHREKLDGGLNEKFEM
jgi:REP-associated tyrosine transposase